MSVSGNGRVVRPYRLTNEFLAKTIEAERCVLSIGLVNHVAIRDAARVESLDPFDFIGPDHEWLFAIIVAAADLNRDLSPSDFEWLAVHDYIDREVDRRNPSWRQWLYGLYGVDYVFTDLPLYCEAVRFYIGRREQAAASYDAWKSILHVGN